MINNNSLMQVGTKQIPVEEYLNGLPVKEFVPFYIKFVKGLIFYILGNVANYLLYADPW